MNLLNNISQLISKDSGNYLLDFTHKTNGAVDFNDNYYYYYY